MNRQPHPRFSTLAMTGACAGFSLMELIVTCSIVGIVVAAAVPNMRSYRESHRMWSETQQIAAICRAAQARARSENHSIYVEYLPDDGQYLVVDDENENGSVDAGETVTVHPIREGLSIASTTFAGDRIVYDSRGRATGGGAVTISGGSGVMAKRLVIAAGTGHVRITGQEADVEIEPMPN